LLIFNFQFLIPACHRYAQALAGRFIKFSMNQFSNKTVYFIGIGGIGISALAKLALHQGAIVSGIDLVDSDVIDNLKKLGAKIKIGDQNNCYIVKLLNCYKKPDLVVYSTAVPESHPDFKKALELKIPIKTYPQILGEISKSYFTIAVSGMHGKSTTTTMIGLMLESAGLDPLVIVGTKVKQWHGNIRIPHETWNMKHGTDPLFVVEADEYKSAMLNLEPNIIILTRIEEDHLDYFKNLAHIKSEFKKYLRKLPDNGCAVVNWGDKNIKSIVSSLSCSIVKYNDSDSKIIKKIKKILKVPGRHNIQNALAVYRVGERMGLNEKQILAGLSKFKGIWRRMEVVGELKIKNLKLKIISDYAHHPTEIKATLQAVREKYPKKRILLAYQPHQHNRTKKLFKDFITAFDHADILILNEIFDVAGREADLDQDISSKDLVREIKKRIAVHCSIVPLFYCCYTKTFKETKQKILELIKPNDIIVIMGAGDIDSVARELVKQRESPKDV
jgi:UDP-N-acetylmuramate--alanine ligase